METQAKKEQKLTAKLKKIKTRSGTPLLAMGGGIFRPTTRKKVLGIVKRPEPGMSTNQFWYRRRNEVERALLDLQLFIKVAGKNNINQVLTKEALRPVFEALLWHPVVERDEPDLNRAEIAQLLIETGFSYLLSMKRDSIPSSSRRTIREAIDASNYLVLSFKANKGVKP